MPPLSLVNVLRWQSPSGTREQFENLDSVFECYVSNLWVSFLERLSRTEGDTAREISSSLERLTSLRRKEFLLSPTVTAALRHLETRANLDFSTLAEAGKTFLFWLEAETDPEKVLSRTEGPLWLVDGSVCYRPDFFNSALSNCFEETSLCQVFEAPRLEQKTVLDFHHPLVWKHVDVGIQNWTEYPAEGTQHIVETLGSGLEALALVPKAKAFLIQNTSVLHFRKTRERPTLGSSTNFLRIGSSFIRNADAFNCSALELAELALHESIHNYLGKYEVTNSMFLEGGIEELSLTESPWTGNIIPVLAFAQAIYVWFGLWNLYLGLEENGLDTREVRKKKLQCAAGFLRVGSLVDITPVCVSRFSSRLQEDAQRMIEIVRSHEDKNFACLSSFRRRFEGISSC